MRRALAFACVLSAGVACGDPQKNATPAQAPAGAANVVQIDVAANVDGGAPLATAPGSTPSPASSRAEGPLHTADSTRVFDRGAVAQALGSVDVNACRDPNGPRGSGHVKIVFSPDGHVQSASVDGGPFPGTPAGACIASAFRNARIPPFDGVPVTVGKSFTIQ